MAAALSFDPPELRFEGVQLCQGYIRKVTVQNNLAVAVEASIKPGSPERYSVQPSSFRLAAGSSTSISVHLKVVKFAQKQKAAAQGQRDIFHVKAAYFEQKLYATFVLASDQLLEASSDRPRTRTPTPVPTPLQRPTSFQPASSKLHSTAQELQHAMELSNEAAAPPHLAEQQQGIAGDAREAALQPSPHLEMRVAHLSTALQKLNLQLREKDALVQALQARLQLAEQQQQQLHVQLHRAADQPRQEQQGLIAQLRQQVLELQGQVQAASARSCQQQPQEAAQAVQAAVRAEQAIRAADRGKAEAYMRNQAQKLANVQEQLSEARHHQQQLQQQLAEAAARADDAEAKSEEATQAQTRLCSRAAVAANEYAKLHADATAEIAHLQARACEQERAELLQDTLAQELREKVAEAAGLRKQLHSLQGSVDAAMIHAAAVLARGAASTSPAEAEAAAGSRQEPDGAKSIGTAVEQLIEKLKEKDGALQRARTAARAAEEKREREATAASRQPLDASQRAVIRDLSLKVAHLSRSLQKAKSERDQLQERLRSLRASLGSAAAATAHPPVASKADMRSNLSRHAMEQLGAASLEAVTKPPPDPTDLEGLCALLELHLATLAQAQEPLHSLHFPGDGKDEDQRSSRCAQETVAQAAAQILTEVTAMRCTVRVLASCVPPAGVGAGREQGRAERDDSVLLTQLTGKVAKWKGRCRQLRLEAAAAAAEAVRHQTALQERILAGESAALEAAAQHDAASTQLQAQRAQQERQATVAEADARTSSYAKALADMQACLEREKGERGRMLATLRETIAALRGAGEQEERLRQEAADLQARLHAAEAAEAQAQVHGEQHRQQHQQLLGQLQEAEAKQRQVEAAAELAQHGATLHASHLQSQLSGLQEELHAAAQKCEHLQTVWTGRLGSLEAKLAAAAVPPEAVLQAVQSLECQVAHLSSRLRTAERTAQELDIERANTGKLQRDLMQAAADRAGMSSSLQAAEQAAAEAVARADALDHQLEQVKASAERQHKAQTAKHRAAMRELQGGREAEREAASKQLDEAAAAHAVLQDRLAEAEAEAAAEGARAERGQAAAAASVQALRGQFRAYQQGKAEEVAGLEARLRRLLGIDGRTLRRKPRQPSVAIGKENLPDDSLTVTDGDVAVKELEGLRETEAVAAAMREAEFERTQKESAETSISDLQGQLEELGQKLRAARQEAKAAQERAHAAVQSRKEQAASDQLRLQASGEALAGVQEAVRAARAESARRLSALQGLQAQAARAGPTVAAADHAAEKAARDAAERNLAQARTALMHRGQLIEELRKRVEAVTAEQGEAARKAAQLHAACSRKDTALQDQRAALEAVHSRVEAAEDRAAELQRSMAASDSIQAQLQGSFTAQAALLDQTRQQLSAAEAELGAAGSREKALLNGGSEAARQHAKLQQSCAHLQQQLSVSCLQAQELVRALAVAGGTTARCIAATGKVATRLQRGQSQQVCFEGATAEGIADLVDMSAEEVNELLRGEASIRALPAGKLLQAVERTCSSLTASLSSGKAVQQSQAKDRHETYTDSIKQQLDGMLKMLEMETSRLENWTLQLPEMPLTAEGPSRSQRNRRKPSAGPGSCTPATPAFTGLRTALQQLQELEADLRVM